MYHLLQRSDFENAQAVGKALLKYAYRNGKVDALDFLLQYDFVRNREQLLAEIVQEDEQGVDIDLQTMAQIDAVPIAPKSMSSARPVYPSHDETITN